MAARHPIFTSLFQRALRFWGSHLLLLHVCLLGLVCLLYGDLRLFGLGRVYAEYARDFSLEDLSVSDAEPHVENILLPAIAAAFKTLWTALGFEYTDTTFVVLAAIPYVLFIYGVSRHLGARGGRVLAVTAAITLYTSGMIPYMTSWGGYVDGLAYLLMLPVVMRPDSLVVYVVTFILQCATHYLGALALVVFAFVWISLKALEKHTSSDAVRYWLLTFGPRAALSLVILAAFMWFWEAHYPDVARLRQQIVAQKWENPAAAVEEVLIRFPWTLLSTLKLAVLPVAALAMAPLPRRGWRILALSVPFLAATALTLLFFDVTRVATMAVMPALLVTMLAVRRDAHASAAARRPVRRILILAAVLNLLIPNYYVNDGDLELPASQAIRFMISTAIGLFT